MSTSLKATEQADCQRAFVGLLSKPLVTPWSDETLYLLVHRHLHTLQTWCRRVHYRLMHVEQTYRLRRPPLPGMSLLDSVSIANQESFTRTEILLRLYVAACLDGSNRSSVTLQDLSNEVRNSSQMRGVCVYEPDIQLHRRRFVKALEWLNSMGILEERTAAEMRENWENTGEGIGAGYLIHHDALMLLLDTEDISTALAAARPSGDAVHEAPTETARFVDDDVSPQNQVSETATLSDGRDPRGVRLLRMLIEQEAIDVAALREPEREYLFGPQRTRLFAQAEEMTGGEVEIHSDLILLGLHADLGVPESALLQFPQSNTLDWMALAFISALMETSGADSVSVHEAKVCGERLYQEHKDQLTKDLSESPQVLVSKLRQRLESLGLLQCSDTEWRLTGLAARYREAQLSADAPHEPSSQTTETETEALTLW